MTESNILHSLDASPQSLMVFFLTATVSEFEVPAKLNPLLEDVHL